MSNYYAIAMTRTSGNSTGQSNSTNQDSTTPHTVVEVPSHAGAQPTVQNPTYSPATVWSSLAVFVLIATFFKFNIHRKLRYSIRKVNLGNIPCKNCRFYCTTPRSQCAIHPQKNLHLEAADCTDYWSYFSSKFSCSNVKSD